MIQASVRLTSIAHEIVPIGLALIHGVWLTSIVHDIVPIGLALIDEELVPVLTLIAGPH